MGEDVERWGGGGEEVGEEVGEEAGEDVKRKWGGGWGGGGGRGGGGCREAGRRLGRRWGGGGGGGETATSHAGWWWNCLRLVIANDTHNLREDCISSKGQGSKALHTGIQGEEVEGEAGGDDSEHAL